MIDRSIARSRTITSGGALTILALATIAVLSFWLTRRLGGFELMSTIDVNGQSVRVVSTFATVDHPFHAARADALLASLQHWQPLRWIANHQGGYPAEFYPLGIAWFDVGVWALLAGQFPVIAVHKLVVILIFLMPVIGFWILARGDRLNPFVPVLALVIHISVPGDWMHGGRTELLYWGLASNVAGATFAFITLAALSRLVREGNRWFAILAILFSSAAMFTNTRSAIALVVATIAVVASNTLFRTVQRNPAFGLTLRRVVFVGAVSLLLTAPLVLALAQYVHLYYFVNFEEYDSIGGYISASTTSITPYVLIASLVTAIAAIGSRSLPHTRAAAIALLLFMASTLALSNFDWLADLIQQLETPRLMPFQRFLSVYLAAAGVGWVLERLVKRVPQRGSEFAIAGSLATVSLIVILIFNGVFGQLSLKYQQPVLWTTGYPEFVEFSDAVERASSITPEGSAIYVVGDRQSWWHEALWAPTIAEQPFFYDDFMWFWHEDHQGPYDNHEGHAYHDPEETFNPEWLHAHGIGTLVVTNMPVPVGATDPRIAVRDNPNFSYESTTGFWDIYQVNDPVAIVTNGDTDPKTLTIENERIEASFDAATGEILIRRNWFPRWEAFADGEGVDVTRTSNGYMSIDVPPDTENVELRYTVTGVDWLGRVASIAGIALLFYVGVGRRFPGWLSQVFANRRPTMPTSTESKATEVAELV